MEEFTTSLFAFEDGSVLKDVVISYQTWGEPNERRDNAVLVCHTLTANTVVSDWWGPLLGPDRAIDPGRDWIICPSVIGSPYGDCSPLSRKPGTDQRYGPDFPAATIRDSVSLQQRLLDNLGVSGIRLAIGASLGGMQVLEWALMDDRVEAIVPIGVGAQHSAWSIGWSETQRQCIYADPNWNGGYYADDAPPNAGLAAARMMAMISYRSAESFDRRFGRDRMPDTDPPLFAVESYLRYQGKKLSDRFDANCYVSLTKQMNSHDVGRGRGSVEEALGAIQVPALVVGTSSDLLYLPREQEELARLLPDSKLAILNSPHGHDAFYIELEELNRLVVHWRRRVVEHQPVEEEQCHAA